MQRAQALGLGLVVAAGAAVLAWFALRGDDAGDEPEPRDVTSASGRPVVSTMDDLGRRQQEHQKPWPFKEFVKDLEAIRADAPDEQSRMTSNGIKIYNELVDVDFKGATIDEVIEELRRQTKESGVRIFTYDNGDLAGVRFTVKADSVQVDELIGLLHVASQQRMLYYTTSQGLCLGSQRAIERAQIDAREALAKERAEGDRTSPILDAKFRPDFADARIDALLKAIREQTGVQVVTDAPTWLDAKTLTWRADEMPLRTALDKICEELRCVYRVREGRIYLIKP